MPTYAYACKDCGHSFDIHQSFSDDSLTVCPTCEGRLRKKFGAVGVSFKGSGFYRNDSRAGASTGSSGSSDSAGSTSDSGSSSSSDSGSSGGSSSEKASAGSASGGSSSSGAGSSGAGSSD
ncbi:FmdB family zinc ribbon protein [Nesterenkonia marinintestina]|uniref:FmdB family zinc ribbon protein n=1 Tax=Nesterenkonia marinintestina TaxID=2979865 RepID=UPI0021C09646|nr:FmdB family zinc ribbon protein [Nesterenkonia sp. GX14115]